MEKASLSKNDSSYELNIIIQNKGVAPFYYDWPVSVAIYDGSKIVKETNTTWKISEIAEGSKKEFSFNLGSNYSNENKILLRIKNPMENGYPVRFSNETQDKDVTEYLTLF